MHPILLNIRDITKIYPHSPHPIKALAGVSLEVHQGEILGLLGVNGAGKTTLSSIIATLHPATTGDIIWKGQSIYKVLLDYRRTIGFCPQKQNFDALLTVAQNLIFAGRYFLIPEKEIKKRLEEVMDQFNLTNYANYPLSSLSGGYRQRLLIARSLMHSPTLIILDEPTIALDPHTRRQLWDTIFSLKRAGTTIVFTTHYLEEAEVLSDRVCIMDKGRIRLIDKPQNLMSAYNKNKLEDVFLQLMQENHNDT